MCDLPAFAAILSLMSAERSERALSSVVWSTRGDVPSSPPVIAPLIMSCISFSIDVLSASRAALNTLIVTTFSKEENKDKEDNTTPNNAYGQMREKKTPKVAKKILMLPILPFYL